MPANWQRLFAYITGSIVFGLLIVIFTHFFFGYVNEPGWKGYVTLFGYGLIYLNFAYIINRRFIYKSDTPSVGIGYLMSLLLVLPTLIWIFTKESELGDSELTFTLTILFADFLGTFYGVKTGSRLRKTYLDQKRVQDQSDLPDDLQRPHNDLGKN